MADAVTLRYPVSDEGNLRNLDLQSDRHAALESLLMANLQAIGSVAGRVIQARNNPLARGVARGAFVFGKKLGHVLHLLFLEMTGFLFICLSLGLGGAAHKEWLKYAAGDHGADRMFKVGVAGGLALMFFYFGVTSFFRAKRKAKKAAAKAR
jgi:hypothetical protein